MILVFVAELGLGLGLIGTAVTFGRSRPTLPVTVVRTGTALIFLVAVGVLNEMGQRRPDSGCGCFGELRLDEVLGPTGTRESAAL